MQITPITVQSIATDQTVQNNRVETVRREYVDNRGRVEITETRYYYYLYDSKGKIAESTPNSSVDLRV